jgi:hypothetical protein
VWRDFTEGALMSSAPHSAGPAPVIAVGAGFLATGLKCVTTKRDAPVGGAQPAPARGLSDSPPSRRGYADRGPVARRG